MNLYLIPSKQQVEAGAQPEMIENLGKTFRECGLIEDGATLQLREPPKRAAQ